MVQTRHVPYRSGVPALPSSAPRSAPPSHEARSAPPSPVVLFDGVCNLCNGAVTWLLERDKRHVLRFGALQSEAAQRMLEAFGARDDLPDSIVLIDAAGVHTRSDAALRIASYLGLPWSLLSVGRVLPRALRNAIYDWIARHRYRWFGKRDSCMLPSPGVADRFLSQLPTIRPRLHGHRLFTVNRHREPRLRRARAAEYRTCRCSTRAARCPARYWWERACRRTCPRCVRCSHW